MGGPSASGDRPRLGTQTIADSLVDSAGDPAELRLQRGTSVERYVVLYELGVGGMGVVYAAYDPELDRKVALKLLHADSRSTRARTRLLREAKAIARLSHPNVVTVHDVGTYEGRVFIAMEFIDGVTFRQWVQQTSRPWSEIVQTLRAAGEGVAAAHDADLIHRDFKPDNILVEPNGRVVVLDFGLARRASTSRSEWGAESGEADIVEEEHDEPTDLVEGDEPPPTGNILDIHLTRTGARIGTPAYMAPEQHLSAPTDARTDQFSFCVVMWEALYGARPFRADSATATAVQVVRGDIQEPPRGSSVPAWVRRVLTRGLNPSPDDRYPDMRSMLDELSRNPGRRRRIGAGAGGVVVAAALAAWAGVRAATAEPELCTTEQAAQRWSSVWNDQREAAVRTSFMQTELPYAEMTADTVERTIEQYADQWTGIYTEACRATHILREQSEEMLDLQMNCLRTRHSNAASLVDEFEQADTAVVQNAVEAILSLPRLDACKDTQALAGGMRLPEDSQTRDVVEDARGRLSNARAKGRLGRYALALEVVQAVRRKLDAVDYPPAEADALLLEGRILERVGDFEAAEQRLLEAIIVAEAVGYDDAAADAWVQLVWVAGVERVDTKMGHLWSRFARAAVERAGSNELLAAQLTHNTGGVFYRQGRHDEALDHYRRALKVQTTVLGPDDPQVAMTLNHIGNAMMEMGEYATSREYCERSLEVRRKALGSRHPKVAASLNNLAELFRKKADHERSLEYTRQSLNIVGGTGGPEEEIARILASDALKALGRWEERIANDRRLLEMRRRGRSPGHPTIADASRRVARSLVALSRGAEATALFEQAISIERKSNPVRAAEMLLEIVEIEAGTDPERARARLAEARGLLQASGQDVPQMRDRLEAAERSL